MGQLRGGSTVGGRLIATKDEILPYNGTTKAEGKLYGGTTAPTGTTRVNYDGDFYATRIFSAVYNDYAEYFEKGGEIEAGDIVILNPYADVEEYIKSDVAFSPFVVGVVSDEYAHCIGGNGDGNDELHYAPVGLAGRVSVKIVGAIKKGDLIVSSDIAGVGMACAKDQYVVGTVVGKALEDYDGSEGIKRVRMLIFNA